MVAVQFERWLVEAVRIEARQRGLLLVERTMPRVSAEHP
jgi:hypothetical protein